MSVKQKSGIKKYSSGKSHDRKNHAFELIQKEIDRVDPDMCELRPIGKHRGRYMCRAVVQSIEYARQSYPMVLDVQNDGAFSSATYPSRIPSNKLKDVAVILAHENYHTRYGKFMVDFWSREVKFRVFRSSADIISSVESSCKILRVLPVQMLDRVSQAIDGIICDDKKECIKISNLIEKGTVEMVDVHSVEIKKKKKVCIKSSAVN